MSQTFFDIVSAVLSAATWTNRGETPLIKRFTRESWQALLEFGMLLQDTSKDPILAANGSVIYQDVSGIVYLADTQQELLDLAELDLKEILKNNFCFKFFGVTYDTPGDNSYGFAIGVKVIAS